MTVTITLSEQEAREYLKFRESNESAAKKIEELKYKQQTLVKYIYNALAMNDEGVIEIINGEVARSALSYAEYLGAKR